MLSSATLLGASWCRVKQNSSAHEDTIDDVLLTVKKKKGLKYMFACSLIRFAVLYYKQVIIRH